MSLLGLQRQAGNAAVATMVAARQARLARVVTTTGRKSPHPLLDGDSSLTDCTGVLTVHIISKEPIERALGSEYVEGEIKAVLARTLWAQLQPMLIAPEPYAIDVVAAPVLRAIRTERDQRHSRWFDEARAAYEADEGREAGGELRSPTLRKHEELRQDPLAAHFGHLDELTREEVLWRFTSRPQSEVVSIDASVPFKDIVGLISEHSGGNKKNDPRVRTLSFGRNLGALIGTAYSAGGDAGVAAIAVRAEYLYGVPIDALAGTGITAHPAEARLISLFETEYVLVATPGDPPRKLDDLATIKLRNPFKGMGSGGTAPLLPGKDLGPVPDEPPAVEGWTGQLGTMAPEVADKVMDYAAKARTAATQQAGVVKDKEGADARIIRNAMGIYLRALSGGHAGGPSPREPVASPSSRLVSRSSPLVGASSRLVGGSSLSGGGSSRLVGGSSLSGGSSSLSGGSSSRPIQTRRARATPLQPPQADDQPAVTLTTPPKQPEPGPTEKDADEKQ